QKFLLFPKESNAKKAVDAHSPKKHFRPVFSGIMSAAVFLLSTLFCFAVSFSAPWAFSLKTLQYMKRE
ncbi:MAG: hypothetical protein IJY76_07350, partial [Anaerotignum sp.]|nr:hypothetical protein [Anaerotignum sp.]